jgi:prepilin-type processing-associated H-X9-DG protein
MHFPRLMPAKGSMAFTLVELLVVIAITVLLAALALPAWKSYRERADATACGGNLRALYLGLSMYNSDHGSVPKQPNVPWRGVPWMVALKPYLDLKDHTDPPGINRQLICPSARKYVTAEWQWYFSTYAANWHAALDCSEQVWVFPARNLALQRNPSEVLAFFDYVPGFRTPNEFSQRQNSQRDEIFRHNGKMNAVFLDGHVKQLAHPLPTDFNTLPWRSDL